MKPEKFVDNIVKSVIEGGVASYREIFADPGEVTDPYWKRVLELYSSLSPAQREVILEIKRQAEVDTVSYIFGILDGSTQLNGEFLDFDLIVKTGKTPVRLNGDLQDLLLERTEAG